VQQIGRYQVIERLGRGAMGVVYRALDPRIGRTVAIKSIRLGEISDPSELKRLRDRLEREARSAGALSHRNIVTVYDILEEEKLVHLFMEYVNGPSLEKMLSERKMPSKEDILEFLRQVATGLDYAHRVGIVHRDVKPSNLMLHFEKGTREQVAKITDFGVAKFVSQQMTQAGSMMGTPNYMAPEQIEGSQVSGQTDQFALAAVTYEVLTSEKPFVADYLPTLFFRIVREEPQPAMEVNPLLSPHISDVLQKGLAKKPADRFETCTQFLNALANACESHPGWSPPYPMGNLEIPAIEEPEPAGIYVDAAASAMSAGLANPASAETVQIGAQDRPAMSAPNPPRFGMPAAAPPPPPPPPKEESPFILPYELPASRRRDWDEEEEPESSLPVWRKIAIAIIICAMAAAGFVIYRNYMGVGESAESTAQTDTSASTAATPPPSAAPAPNQPVSRPAPPATSEKPSATPTPQAEEPAKQPTNLASTDTAQLPGVAPSKPAVTQGRVQFTSDPSQAEVVVDSDPSKTCHTPCSLTLSPGRHTLTMTAPSYGVAHRIIQVPDTRDVFVPLAQNIGIVQMDSIPSGSTVYVDGRMLGQTPTTLKLTAGPHQVRLMNGSRSHQETIQVNAESLQQFTFRWQ
jgi:serine/threonine protein kinase